MNASNKQVATVAALAWIALAGCSTDSGGGGAGTPDVQSEAGTLADTTGDTADTASGGDSSDSSDTSDGGGIPAAWTACSQSSDCVPAELACCDHCNGGKLGAFHKDHVVAAKAALGPAPGACEGTMCTAMGCGPAVAWCEDGVCEAGQDPGFGKACAELDETTCKASKLCVPMNAWAPPASCQNVAATPVYQGCHGGDVSCGDAMTCAAEPKTGALWVFPSTCLPAGWTAKDWDACCPSSSGTCSAGKVAEIGKLCLLPKGGAGTIEVGEAFDVQVWPKGCFSSSCTKVHQASCSAAIDGAGDLAVGAQVCIESTGGPGVPCTADCSGAGQASCAAPALAAGSYEAKLGGLTLAFDVPGKPGATLCVGSQF